MSKYEYETIKIFSRKLKYYMKLNGMNNAALAPLVNVSKQSVSYWVNAERMPRMDKIEKLCRIFGISKSDLLEEDSKFPAPAVTDNSAAYSAAEDLNGDKIEIPRSYLKGGNYNDYICLKIRDDSMYPLYHIGDKVLILKQNDINQNGDIAAVAYGNEYGILRKIEFSADKTSIKLVPVNPQHTPATITGEDVEKCHIIGIPKLIIREV